nr:peptidoglycan-binding domain-containing protein [Ruminococcus bromii]
MSNSKLVNCTKLSPNHSGKRTHSIDRITPHCVVGQCSVETLGDIFQNTACEASCNYGIGYDGRVLLCVDEGNRSWCSSSNANDQRAVTIECASDTTAPYAINSKVYNKLVALCVDICKRNGKTKLLWFGNEDKTLNYSPKSGEMVLTVHRWFANKSCPGDWLYNRLGNLADEVTAQLGGKTTNTNTDTNTEEEEMIKFGSHNTATLAFKKQLITLYNMKIIKTKVDNSAGFGNGTLKAVKEVQKLAKITVDGIVGEKTINAIYHLINDCNWAKDKKIANAKKALG